MKLELIVAYMIKLTPTTSLKMVMGKWGGNVMIPDVSLYVGNIIPKENHRIAERNHFTINIIGLDQEKQ